MFQIKYVSEEEWISFSVLIKIGKNYHALEGRKIRP